MRRYLGEVEERSLTAHFIYILGVRRYQTLVGMVPSSAFAVSVPGLLADTFPSFVATAFVVPLLVFWAPTLGLFCRTTRFCPYRPNPFIDMYDDPRSCHWLNRPPTNSAVEDARPPVPLSGPAR